jgi:hypothetical protein
MLGECFSSQLARNKRARRSRDSTLSRAFFLQSKKKKYGFRFVVVVVSLLLLLIVLGLYIFFLLKSPFLYPFSPVSMSSGITNVWVIVEENHSGEEIYNNTSDAPYFNQLASQYAVLKGYSEIFQSVQACTFGLKNSDIVSGTSSICYQPVHPSLPNYLALTAGDTFGIQTDSISDWSDLFSGAPPIQTDIASLLGGRFTPECLNIQHNVSAGVEEEWCPGVYSGIVSEETCPLAEVKFGCIYATQDEGPNLGVMAWNRQGEGGSVIEIQNVTITTVSRCWGNNDEISCRGDGDAGFETSDSSYQGAKVGGVQFALHTEVPPLWQTTGVNTWGAIAQPKSGGTYNIIGVPYCDDHYLSITNDTWHTPIVLSNGTIISACDEIHPVLELWPSGTPQPVYNNIFSLIQSNGSTWQVLAQSMPSNCYIGDSGDYLQRHNPATFYYNIQNTCKTNDIAYSGSSLPASSLENPAALTFIIPDVCNDMHGGTGCPSDLIKAGDTYLSEIVPQIMNTPSYKSGHGIIFITFDESDSSSHDVTIPTLAISPLVKNGYISHAGYNHYSLLATIEKLLGLPCTGRFDCTATPFNDIWKQQGLANHFYGELGSGVKDGGDPPPPSCNWVSSPETIPIYDQDGDVYYMPVQGYCK